MADIAQMVKVPDCDSGKMGSIPVIRLYFKNKRVKNDYLFETLAIENTF